MELADYCSNDDAGNGCTFGEGKNANLQLFGAQLTLSDDNLPTGTAPGGLPISGAPIPPGGKQLVLEASSGGEWVQFDTISTGAKGRFRSSYRFKFPGPVTYRFRILSRYEADLTFLGGTSNVVGVHER